ncbi:MAG: helix-turn-helix domain-containing protein [Chloroflexi bacterium]|nr:helix-turn-helix domain-containing protein [Chloroflexota bacterium]
MRHPRAAPDATITVQRPTDAQDRPAPSQAEVASAGSNLRRALLLRLRHDGPSTPEDLAMTLDVSRTGVLQQLHALETAGLVSRQSIKHGVGRPRHVYDVTAAAQDLFPTNYHGLAAGLLAAIRSIGGEPLVEGVFEERRRISRDRIQRRLAERLPADASLAERSRELAVIQDEQGYLAETLIGTDGVIRLVERNCAIHRVVAEAGAACQAELDLFREILGAEVERETHIAAGDRCCTYRIGGTT